MDDLADQGDLAAWLASKAARTSPSAAEAAPGSRELAAAAGPPRNGKSRRAMAARARIGGDGVGSFENGIHGGWPVIEPLPAAERGHRTIRLN
jgi:hypothetical protein